VSGEFEFVWPTAFDESEREHLSASSINMLMRCEQQYAFRYFEGLKAPPKAAMVQGSSVDDAANFNFRQKILSGSDRPLPEVLDAAATSFERRKDEIEDWSMSPGAAKDGVIAMTQEHHTSIAPKVQPVAVQEEFWLYSGEWDLPVLGFKDVRTSTETRDLKTTTRTKSQKDLESDIQAGIYLLASHASQEAERFVWDQIVQLKNGPKVAELERIGTQASYDITIRMVAVAEQRIAQMRESGIFKPADPSHWACGYCGYRNICPYIHD